MLARRHAGWWALALALLVAVTGCTADAGPGDPDAGAAASTTVAARTATTSDTIAPGSPTTTTPAVTTAPIAGDTAPPAPARYGFPVADVGAADYEREHHDYPAADIFARCGASIVSPVAGIVVEVRRIDEWQRRTDDPATRGGRSVTVVGDDGVRYYFAHFEAIVEPLEPGAPIALGDELGTVGRTGRASSCHLHFGLSPPCPGQEWAVRRGVIPPWPYLDAWRAGEPLSPAEETKAWQQEHPEACAEAMADPYAANSWRGGPAHQP